ILHDFGQRLAAAHVVERENLEDEILGGDVGPAFPSYHDLYGLGHAHAHVFGDPGIEYVGGADAESHASDSAHVRSMRVGANVELPGEGVAFQHDGVADALAALAVAQLAVQADSLLFGEVLLLELQLRGQVEQAHPALLLRDHVVQEGEMVAEEQDGGGIVDLGVLAHEVLEKDGGHGGDVLVAEAEVGGCKPCISRLDEEASGSWRLAIGCRRSAVCQILCGRGRPRPRNSHTTVSAVRQLATADWRLHHVPRKDLLGQSHRPRRSGDGRHQSLALHARHVEREETAVLNHLAGDLVLALGEFAERDLLAASDALDEAEVGGGQHTQVLAVLLVDALDVLGDHQLDAGGALGVGRLLAAGALAAALAADRADEAAALHIAALDGELIARLQAGVGELAQGLVEEEADVGGGDLV